MELWSHFFGLEACMRAASRLLSAGVGMLVCGVGAAGAQGAKTNTEVGTSVGVTILSVSGGGGSVTHVGIPGDGIQASPTVYATIFASPSFMVEPQVAFSLLSSGGQTLTSVGLALQFGYLVTPSYPGSVYVAANGAFQSVSLSGGGGSVSGPGLGGALGYRFKVRNNLAIRLDGRYRRWFSDFKDLNEIGFGLGLGATF